MSNVKLVATCINNYFLTTQFSVCDFKGLSELANLSRRQIESSLRNIWECKNIIGRIGEKINAKSGRNVVIYQVENADLLDELISKVPTKNCAEYRKAYREKQKAMQPSNYKPDVAGVAINEWAAPVDLALLSRIGKLSIHHAQKM